MMIRDFLTQAKVVKASNGATAGTSLVTSSTIDTAGYDNALIIADLGTVTSGGVSTLQAQDGAASGGGDAANITGASVTHTDVGGADSNGQLVLDLVLPQKRYLTITLTRATANIVLNSITIILYRTKNAPPATQPTTVLASAIVEAAS